MDRYHLIFDRMRLAYEQMPETQKRALRAWESTNVGPHSNLTTADWDGWHEALRQLAEVEDKAPAVEIDV